MPTELEQHLIRKIAGLDTVDRRAVYDETRAALQNEVRAAAPFISVSIVVARRRELEDAILAVEREWTQSGWLSSYLSEPERPPESRADEPAQISETAETLAPEPPADADIASLPQATVDAEADSHSVESNSEEPATVPVPLAAAREGTPVEEAPVYDRQAYGAVRPPAKTARSYILYGGMLVAAVGSIAIAAVIVGIGVERRERAAVPVAAAPLTPGPANELIKGAGFLIAAQAALKDGQGHFARGDLDRAIASFDDAIRFDPSAAAFTSRALAHRHKGSFDAAIRDYGAALEREPLNVSSRLNRALAYAHTGDHQRAADDLDRVLAAESENVNARISRCWSRAVLAHLQEALEDCNVALKQRPADPEALANRGFVYLRLGRLDRAIADYDAALKLKPKQAGSLYGRGLAKIGRGDRAGGNQDVSAARAIDPDIASAFARYGIR